MAIKNTKPIASTSRKVNETSHIMVTLPLTTRKKIEALASKEQRSMAYLCRQFIEQGLNGPKKKNSSK